MKNPPKAVRCKDEHSLSRIDCNCCLSEVRKCRRKVYTNVSRLLKQAYYRGGGRGCITCRHTHKRDVCEGENHPSAAKRSIDETLSTVTLSTRSCKRWWW